MRRMLLIHRGSLGDFLLLLPSLSALRERFPDARIEMLGHTEILSLVCPGIVDSIGSVERAALVPFFSQSAELPANEIRYFSSFDTVLAFISDPDKGFQHNLETLGIKNLIIQPPFPPANAKTHVSKYLFEKVAPLLNVHQSSAKPLGPPFLSHLRDDDIYQSDALLEPALSGGKKIVAIHPGSGSEKKCWPIDRFEALARLLHEKGFALILLLGPADERLYERTLALGEELGCPIARNLPLRRLAALLAQCNAYVGNDSGITHLAASTGIPTVAVFGPTDPTVWAPLGDNVKVVTSDLECNPCKRETMHRCGRRECLEEVSVEDTTATVIDLFGK